MKRGSFALAITCLSFLLGFIRDIFIARTLGSSHGTDALFVALVIPTFVENIFGIALRDSLIPYFQQSLLAGKDLFQSEAAYFGRRFILLGIGVVTILASSPTFILGLLLPGWSQADIEAAIPQFIIGACSIIFIVWSYFQTALLNLQDRFVLPLWRSVFFNIGALAAIWFYQPTAMSFLTGMLIGMAVHALWMQSILGRYGLLGIKKKVWRRGQFQGIGQQFFPLFGATMALQVNVVAERFFASWLEAGTVTHLSYSYRLAAVPLTLFMFSVLNIIYTSLVVQSGTEKQDSWRRILNKGFAVMMLAMLPAALFLTFFSKQIVSLLFGHGAFSPADIDITANMTAVYAAALPILALALLMGRALLSLGQAREVLKAAVLCMVATLALDAYLMQIYGGLGLAMSASLGACVNASWLGYALSRRMPSLRLGAGLLRWTVVALALAAFLISWPWQNLTGIAAAGIVTLLLAYAITWLLDARGWFSVRNLMEPLV